MITTARELLASFDALPDREKHDFVVAMLRRSTAEGGLTDEELALATEEAFLAMDAEEESQNAKSNPSAG